MTPLLRSLVLVCAALSLSACVTHAPPRLAESPAACPACPTCPTEQTAPPPKAAALLTAAAWADLPGWGDDDAGQAWGALLASCNRLKQPEWQTACAAFRAKGPRPVGHDARAALEEALTPWRIQNADGSTEGLITGYFEPLIRGSRTRTPAFNYPVFGVPDDLIAVDLGSVYPELKSMRLRGRLQGRTLVPYPTRAEIDAAGDAFSAKPIVWTDDPLELLFLQVQGSGQVQLPDGSRIRVAYAEQNGHPYQAIGRWLVDKGELKVDQASMEGIRSWARAHPQRLQELLNANASYVFFREQPASKEGPNGSLGVPLTAGRSIAVDVRSVPSGAPVFLATTWPATDQPLRRLVLAQDTGGAIKGRVRADYYWGFGPEAGAQAGKMRQKGQMWVLWPKSVRPPGAEKNKPD